MPCSVRPAAIITQAHVSLCDCVSLTERYVTRMLRYQVPAVIYDQAIVL